MIRKLLAMLVLAFIPHLVMAAAPTYTGNVNIPVGGNLTLLSGGTGCALVTLGQVSGGICPAGTAVFSAGTNITITGSNPYTINCPNCAQLTNTPQTFAGTLTFSNTTTFSSLLTGTAGATFSSSSVPVKVGASGAYTSGGVALGTTGGFAQLTTTSSSIATCAIVGNELALQNPAGSLVDTFDTSGNLCSLGTQYYVSSKSEKRDIRPAWINGLLTIDRADFNLSWEYKRALGVGDQVHYGPMAESLPTFISGPNHGRIDIQALLTTEAVAIQELSALVAMLFVWCLALTIALVRFARRP